MSGFEGAIRWGRGQAGRIAFARLCFVVAALACVAGAAAATRGEAGAGVLKVRLAGDAHQTRVVIEMDRSASGRLLQGGETPGPEVVLALPSVGVSGEMTGQGAGLVRSWTVDEAAGAARVRLALVRDARVKRRFLLPPGDGFPAYRYVLDVTEDAPKAVTDNAFDRAPSVGVRIKHGVEAVLTPLQPVEPSRKVVVIDAGHGGKDPGAAGGDSHEKTFTLAAARALRDRLESSGRYKVVMTRDGDCFVPLGERVEIARRANADLFISLHADSGPEPDVRGATVYTLSEHGVDRVAKHVIGADRDWFMHVDLPGGDPAVNRILLDLTQRETRNRSSTFAGILLDQIGERTTLLRRSHRDAGFMVLLAPDVPAVLLEMGFITNREDERALADPDHRRRVMDAVGDAIDAYFVQEAKYAAR